ncbi:MAG: hypothetical protein V3R53_05045 [Gammaproteobacteria bacterium]
MKGFVGILGILIGAGCAAALLLLNPFYPHIDPSGSVQRGPMNYDYSASEYRGIAMTPQSLLGISGMFGGGGGFPSDGIRHTAAAVMLLRNRDGQTAALAIKLSAVAATSQLLVGDLGIDSYWNVFWPNLGSVFLVGRENYWPVIRDVFIAGLRGEGPLPAGEKYSLTVRPEGRRVRGVLGSSGRFTGATGLFQDSYISQPDSPSGAAGMITMQINVE